MPSQRPSSAEHSNYHQTLISLVPDGSILKTLSQQLDSIPQFVASIPVEAADVIHEPYGWTVRQVIEHCLDAERVFGYRTLRFATNEDVELPGWDENFYAQCGYAEAVGLNELAQEYMAVRQANICLAKRLVSEAWDRCGTADSNPYSVRSLLWLMAGHWIHHEKILRIRLG